DEADGKPHGLRDEARESAEQTRRSIKATPFGLRDPQSIPPRQWLYNRHFVRKYPSVTVAPGGVGKSSLIFVEALAMARGRDLIGAKPIAPLRVWVWNGEDPLDELERRVTAAAIRFNIGREDIGDRLFVDTGREMPIVLAKQGKDGTTIATP